MEVQLHRWYGYLWNSMRYWQWGRALLCRMFDMFDMSIENNQAAMVWHICSMLIDPDSHFVPGTEKFSFLLVFPGSSGNLLVSDSINSVRKISIAAWSFSSPHLFGECLHPTMRCIEKDYESHSHPWPMTPLRKKVKGPLTVSLLWKKGMDNFLNDGVWCVIFLVRFEQWPVHPG